jgi:hypothetical protein
VAARTSSPSRQSAPALLARQDCNATMTIRKEPPTKTVMKVDSLVANESASSAAMMIGPPRRGRSRKRPSATIMPSVMAAIQMSSRSKRLK